MAASVVSPSDGQTGSWLEVRTPHFLIVSNAPEKDARKAAHQFEGMRSVFQGVFPEADLDNGPKYSVGSRSWNELLMEPPVVPAIIGRVCVDRE
jgi:hypothetical protein